MDKKSGGFTLIELIVVITVFGILALISVPKLFGYIDLSRERVCVANRLSVERLYDAFLLNDEHTDIRFDGFLQSHVLEVCPLSGVIGFVNGRVVCSYHIDDDEVEDEHEENPPGGEIPWL